MASLMQHKSTVAGTGPFTHTWAPYTTQPSINLGQSIVSGYGTAANESRYTLGNIVREMRLSSRPNDVVRERLTYVAPTGDRTNYGAISPQPSTIWTNAKNHLHSDTKVYYDAAVDSKAPEHELVMTNNLISWWGSGRSPDSFALGQLGFSGSFIVTAKTHGTTLYGYYVNKTNTRLKFQYRDTAGTMVLAGAVEAAFDSLIERYELQNREGIRAASIGFRSAIATGSPPATLVSAIASSNLSPA
jgi:hypothetical protein